MKILSNDKHSSLFRRRKPSSKTLVSGNPVWRVEGLDGQG